MGKYVFLGLLIIWYVAFVAGFAFGQDCKYVNTINYDKAGEIINSKQEYNCETPKQIVEVHTYPNEDARNVMSSKVYGIPLNAYENPEQVLYNMQEDLKQQEMMPLLMHRLMKVLLRVCFICFHLLATSRRKL